MNVLVTDGNNRATLAIVRSLGAQHRVTVGSARAPALASVSRYCQDAFTYPDPEKDESGFVRSLAEAVKRHSIELLITPADITTFAVADHRERFEPDCRLPIPSTAALQTAADKAAILRIAQELEVPTPRTLAVLHRPGDSLSPASLHFPLVVKPARSRVRDRGRWRATSVTIAVNADELVRALQSVPAAAYPVLLQERIHGDGTGVFLCYDRGQCIAAFAHHRLREKPPSGGVSVLRESVAIDRSLLRHATQLLDHLHWHGVAMVEFKQDGRDGIAKLMEINGRFWGSLQLAIDAGVDFPKLVASIGGAEPLPAVNGYHLGVRSRWFFGDVDALLMRLFKAAERNKLSPEQRSRSQALRDFLAASVGPARSEIFRGDDWRPGLLEAWRWIRHR